MLRKSIFHIIRRHIHDRKLPDVINSTIEKNVPKVGQSSPKKADYNLNRYDCENESWFPIENKDEKIKKKDSKNKH